MSLRLNPDEFLDLRAAAKKARHDMLQAPVVAHHFTNETPPDDNPNRMRRMEVLSRGLCRGSCSTNVSHQFQRFVMQEPNGCMGVRGTSPERRFKSLGCPPLEPPGCLLVSIGIGMEWDFELQVAARGCEVHAFDPTVALNGAHAQAAATFKKTYPKLHYHFRGLGAQVDRTRGTAKAYGTITDATGSTLGPVHQLDGLMRYAGAPLHLCSNVRNRNLSQKVLRLSTKRWRSQEFSDGTSTSSR